MKYYNEDIEEVYQNLNTSENGLTNEEVKIRINQYGLNILEEGKKKTRVMAKAKVDAVKRKMGFYD